MLATGTDAVAGRFDEFGLRYADDMISLPLQCATQWDALAHIFMMIICGMDMMPDL